MDTASSIAVSLAKPFEGLSLKPYHDPVGYPTIGYGHLLSPDKWADLSQWQPITEYVAEQLLEKDMSSALKFAMNASPILADPQNYRRLGAIGDFVYNLGIGNYNASTLKRKVNAGQWDQAVEQILKWNKAGGKVLKGLVLRRTAESRYLV